jgi:hypothetical protein
MCVVMSLWMYCNYWSWFMTDAAVTHNEISTYYNTLVYMKCLSYSDNESKKAPEVSRSFTAHVLS